MGEVILFLSIESAILLTSRCSGQYFMHDPQCEHCGDSLNEVKSEMAIMDVLLSITESSSPGVQALFRRRKNRVSIRIYFVYNI